MSKCYSRNILWHWEIKISHSKSGNKICKGFLTNKSFFLQQAFEAANVGGKSMIKSAHPFVLLSNHSQLERKHGPVTVKGPLFQNAKMSEFPW